MFNRDKFNSHLPERVPRPRDYDGVDAIEVVHLDIKQRGGNERERLITRRLTRLEKSGIKVRQVDIETPPVNSEKNIVVAGVLGDVCVAKRRRFLRDNGIRAKVDSSLTSDY